MKWRNKNKLAAKTHRKDLLVIKEGIKHLLESNKRGLIAEDDDQVAELIVNFFDSASKRPITHAATSCNFEKNILDNNLAFIFSDVRLGPDSGVEVVYRYWLDGMVNCPIFFYSGAPLTEGEREMVDEMKATFFEKGIDITDLGFIVNQILEQTNA